ncbi:MAG: hypothetical protein KOO62_04890 [candidate division Zixibacteria bacterium]|nr:hypothetical protein [candidate division Zixibacteria bacterium]
MSKKIIGRTENGFLSMFAILTLTTWFVAATVSANWERTATWPRFTHFRTATITYSGSQVGAADFVGRHYDVSINAGGSFYTAIKAANPSIKVLAYMTISTYRAGDTAKLRTFATANGYNLDSLYAFTYPDSSVCIKAAQAVGLPCTGDDAVMCDDNGLVRYCGWNSHRWMPKFQNPNVWEYLAWKVSTAMGSTYDGIMEDEMQIFRHYWGIHGIGWPIGGADPFQTGSRNAIEGWAGMSTTDIVDSMIILSEEGYIQEIEDSLSAHNQLRFGNPAAYGVVETGGVYTNIISQIENTGTGMLLGEGWDLRPTSTGTGRYECWRMMDTMTYSDGHAIVWMMVGTSDSTALGGWSRATFERYCCYQMAADTGHFYMMLTGSGGGIGINDFYVTDTLIKWLPAFEYNIGQPTGSRTSLGNNCYKREYSQPNSNPVVMFYRHGTSGFSTDTSIALGGNYYELQYDGTLSASTTNTASIRYCEGKVYVSAANPYTGGDDLISPAKINDLETTP